jgi:hypothetical protein
MNSKLRNLLAFLLVTVFAAVFAFGQAETGQVNGTVTDPSGAVVSGAKVTITNNGTGQTRTTQSTANGSYAFTNLQPGNYAVAIEGPGFTPFKGNVDVTVGGRHTMDAKLAVSGGTATTVEVTAEGGAQVNTTDQQLSQVVNQSQIQQLPTLTRNPYDLVGLSGNVSGADPMGSTSRGAGFAINGQRSASTDILLDGGENVNTFTASVGQRVPLDAVQEFRVITSNYTAEYGRASGGVVNVATRSGTNEYHGSVYEFNRLSALASRTYDQSATNFANVQNGDPINPQPRFVRNQFGYALGGPVLPALRNKLFFFSNTEWTRVRSSSLNSAYVLTPQFIAATPSNVQSFFSTFGKLAASPTGAPVTASGAGLSANAIAKLGAGGANFPVLQKVTYSVPGNSGGGLPQNSYSTLNRVDLNLTDKTTLYGRYGLESINDFPGTVSFSPYAGYNTGETQYNQNVLANLTHIFSPTLVTQSKAIYNRLNLLDPLGTQPVGPTLYLTNSSSSNSLGGTSIAFPGYLPFTPGNSIPFGGPQNLYQFYQDLSWTKGNHQLRFGGQYIHARDNRVFGAYETAVENIGSKVSNAYDNLLGLNSAGVSTGVGQLFSFQAAVNPQGKFPCPVNPATGAAPTLATAPANCVLNLPVSAPAFGRNNRYNDSALYAQDTWKTSSKLTLNFGLRWEYYGVQHNANPNLDSNFYFGSGNTLFDRIRNGSVQLAPASPKGSLWSPQYKNFAPRLGFAYDLFGNGKWAIRGGYGISYERNFGNVTFNVIQNPPNYAVISLLSTDVGGNLPITTNNVGPLAGTGQKPLPLTSLRAVDPDIKSSYAHQFSFAIEHEVLKNTMMAVEYSGSRGIHQYSIANINRPSFGNIYESDQHLGNRLNYQYSNINFRGSSGDSYYNGVNLKVQSSNFRELGLQFVANYTYSHTIDDLSSTFSESANNFNLGYLDPFNPGLDRGNADFDVRHRLVLSSIYEPTFLAFKNSGKLVQNVLGGFQFAPVLNFRTGTPFTIYDTTNSSGNAFGRLITSQTNFSHGGGSDATAVGPNVFNYLQIPTPVQTYLGPFKAGSDYPTCGAGGCFFPSNMTGRNAFRGPNNWNLDFNIYKTFRFTERVNLQLRGEFYNVLNHHNFYVVGNNADAANTDTVGDVLPVQVIKGRPNLNDPSQDERRNVQLGLKVNF